MKIAVTVLFMACSLIAPSLFADTTTDAQAEFTRLFLYIQAELRRGPNSPPDESFLKNLVQRSQTLSQSSNLRPDQKTFLQNSIPYLKELPKTYKTKRSPESSYNLCLNELYILDEVERSKDDSSRSPVHGIFYDEKTLQPYEITLPFENIPDDQTLYDIRCEKIRVGSSDAFVQIGGSGIDSVAGADPGCVASKTTYKLSARSVTNQYADSFLKAKLEKFLSDFLQGAKRETTPELKKGNSLLAQQYIHQCSQNMTDEQRLELNEIVRKSPEANPCKNTEDYTGEGVCVSRTQNSLTNPAATFGRK